MMSVYQSVFAVVVKNLEYIRYRVVANKETCRVFLSGRPMLDRDVAKALCVVLVVSLLATASPSARHTIAGLARKSQLSVASWTSSHSLPTKLFGSARGYGNYQNWLSAHAGKQRTTGNGVSSLNPTGYSAATGPMRAVPSSNTIPLPPDAPPVFTDDPLAVGVTVVQALHITELRDAVNLVRARAGLAAASWELPVASGLPIKATHIIELRTRLDDARTALGVPAASYSLPAPSVGGNIRAAHVQELRDGIKEILSTTSSADSALARLDPANRTGGGGEDPLSRNYNWSVPLVSLPGRAGLDLGLSLSHNSLVWTKSGSFISFDADQGFPSAGFRLGFPVIQPRYFNSEVGRLAYLLIAPSGGRVELRQVGTSAFYEAADSSHLLLDSSTSTMILRSTDGTQLSYVWKGSDFQCTQIKDRNGNFITVNYTAFGRIDTVIDTLSRTIKFNYDGNSLSSITQTWTVNGVPETHEWASFTYNPTLPIQTNFSVGVTNVGPQNGSTLKVLTRVTFADSSRFDFDYTSWGQVWKVSNFATDGHLLNYSSYDLRGSPLLPSGTEDDCPRFTQRHDWAKNWNRNESGVEQEVITRFAVPESTSWTLPGGTLQAGQRAQVTTPDNTYHKIYYHGTAGTSTGWHRGLSSMVETFDSDDALQRRSVTTWIQDNITVSYPLNPRVEETNVYDGSGNNRRRVTTGYATFPLPSGSSCRLPNDIREYAADATTVLRRTETDYRMHPTADADYLNRHIIGLVKEQRLYGVSAGVETLMSQLGFAYDETPIQGTDTPVKHDNTNYGASFVVGRANLTKVKRYDTFNTSLFVATSRKYNRAGAVVETTDPANHAVTISYTDAFAAQGVPTDPALPFATLAYPTTVTDADGHSSLARYNYDFGAATWKKTPLPHTIDNPPPPPPEQKSTHDNLGRLERVTNLVNNAYTRFIYGPNYVESFASVNNVADEAHTLQIFDGAGRVIAKASNHPDSDGGFSGQLIIYDIMGRVMKQSNPTETSVSLSGVLQPYNWQPTGDDAAPTGNGWVYSTQTYDWKGRPLVTTNTDSTTKTASYDGCGCAGGEVVTLMDEGTIDAGVAKRRQQKIYSDVLGRTVKTETSNWEGGSPYSTTVNTYNARDQIRQVRQYAGPEGSATYQDTTKTYDGHGRLETKQAPGETAACHYSYNPDDTLEQKTDARGATATYVYNGRHQATAITYGTPGNVWATPNLTFGYDAASNRTSMTDGAGSVSYQYDQLSRMTSETRVFTGFNSYTLNYGYNLANELTSMTDGLGGSVGYTYDPAGRLNGMTSSGYNGGATIASDIEYRAWGALKQSSYDDGHTMTTSYNNRMQLTSFHVGPVVNAAYQYYADGRVSYAQDQNSGVFDRSFSYDHSARLSEAKSGAEARGLTSADGPYKQNFGYDAFNNMRSRTGRLWSQPVPDFSASFVNNRNPNWQYDASGNVTQDDTPTFPRQFKFDAEQRSARMIDPTPNYFGVTFTDTFDGDGQQVKRVRDQVDTTLYIRSTVLGQKVAEIRADDGLLVKREIYGQGKVIARQYQDAPLHIVYNNPVTGSEWWSYPNLSHFQALELDPSGSDVGTTDPYQSGGGISPNYPLFGLPTDLGFGCTIDGVGASCGEAMHLLNRGWGYLDPRVDWRSAPFGAGSGMSLGEWHWVDGAHRPDRSGDGGSRPAVDENGHPIVDEEGHTIEEILTTNTGSTNGYWVNVALFQPQNPTPEERAANRAADLLRNNDCANFIAELISLGASVAGQPGGLITPSFAPIQGLDGSPTPSYGADYGLNEYRTAISGGRVTASGRSGTSGNTVTYGTTTNHNTISWNREFYSLGIADQARHTLHESLHLIPNFSDFALAGAASIIATRGRNNPGNTGNFRNQSAASQYLNQQIARHCR